MKAEEEQKKKKKKPLFKVRKEKRLQYYSGWQRGKPVVEEKQNELDKFEN